VTLHSNDAVQGGTDALVAIRVPNEEDKATTNMVEVDFPADTPLIGVLVQPTPGWQFQATTTALPKPLVTDDGTITQYVSKVVWSGGTIPVGGYQDFNIDVSSVPKVAAVQVKAIQTYSNGDVVRWIDPPPAAGQPAPDHPAPTLTIAAGSDTASPATTTAPANNQPPTATLSGVAKKTDVNTARTVAIIALVVGALGLVAALAAIARRSRTSPST
jgi:uncharacterized protein YcnI